MSVPLLVDAHHLTTVQRNGGSIGYTMLFLTWAGFVALTLISWTVVAVAAARNVTFSRDVLMAEGCLAIAVSLAIVAILAATSCWWAVVAARAPTFLGGRNQASLANGRLVATFTLMALAAMAATVGAVRIARCLPSWRHTPTL